ncbi:MAG TPA: glycoside hydrolase family 3 C-terminal domain-containing protein [Bacteroidales bacterium]|nr:glycoside hydrolase family 3 C-terminal domain-containing protein [Bacteroidales bacterium]
MKKNVVFFLFLTLTTFASAQPFPFQNPRLSPVERAKDLLQRLTLEEKISQMRDVSAAIPRFGMPPFQWWNEALHGVARAGRATVFPQTIGMAATFDDLAVKETFTMVSDEARAKNTDFRKNNSYERYEGLTFWTPNINIFRDPRWGRGMETYGEDPWLTARMGVAVVSGLQGDQHAPYIKTMACAKHYAVHSGPEWNRHSFDAENISQRDLWETYLPAFKALVKEADVRQVMCAYNRFDGKPCCNSNQLLQQILRNDWNYQHIVVSDCWAISDFFQKGHHETSAGPAEASAAAVISGTDLECGSEYRTLGEAVKKGFITENNIDTSLLRLLKARFELGLFDPDSLVLWTKIPMSKVECPEHQAKALEMARKSLVLLSNKRQILPLSKTIRKIAVMGPNANDAEMQWANYNGFPTKTVTILEGIRSKLPIGSVLYEKGCDYVKELDGDNHPIDYEAVAQKVKGVDAIVFVGGISPKLEGEEMKIDLPGFKGGDRTNIDLPLVQEKLLMALKKLGKPVIFVLCSGSSMALPWESKNLDAILAAWYPGQAGGTAVADVLFGDYNPAGRLPVTFYASSNDLPDFQDYDMSKGRTYRYFKGKTLFSFGYGLSYTTFAYSNAKLDKKVLPRRNTLTLSLDLKNTGKMAGDEVVQVYIRSMQDPDGPIRSLRAFRRLHVAAGETSVVRFYLTPKAFEFFDPETNTMKVKPGKYEILYGGTSNKKALRSLIVERVN